MVFLVKEVISILDVSAKWCPPCNDLKKELGVIRRNRPDWAIAEIDSEDGGEGQKFAERFKVNEFPTIFFAVGLEGTKFSEYEKVVGFMSAKEIEKKVLDMLAIIHKSGDGKT